jgi:hypothetical protein
MGDQYLLPGAVADQFTDIICPTPQGCGTTILAATAMQRRLFVIKDAGITFAIVLLWL